MERRIITLSGYKGSGKGEVAKELINLFIRDSKLSLKLSFATPLKQAVKELVGVPTINLDLESEKSKIIKNDVTYRRLLQLLGSWTQEVLGTNHFVDIMETNIDLMRANMNSNSYFIIDDMRFPHELELFEQKYPTTYLHLHILRPSLIQDETHISESFTEYMKKQAHHIIINDGSLEDLKAKVRKIYDDSY